MARHVLHDIEATMGGSFDASTFRKAEKSYSIWMPAVTEAFNRLHRKRTGLQEQKRVIYYFANSALLDNFYDDNLQDKNRREEMIVNTRAFKPTSFEEKVFIENHFRLLDFVKNKDEYLEKCLLLYRAQEDSLKQFNPFISDEEIFDITMRKGGLCVSLCFYYTEVDHFTGEGDLYFAVGCLVQFIDDLFDVGDDIKDNIQTIPSRTKDVASLKHYFNRVTTRVYNAMQSIPPKKCRIKNFRFIINSICALGWLAIEQLEKLEVQYKGLPPLKKLSRKELLIDMEKPSTFMRWIKIMYRLNCGQGEYRSLPVSTAHNLQEG